ncbi:MAG: CBS domain-containing protein [Comamonadaceae bacterium]|nr:CBS domain-containing protein [Comamonadaceae bacterium]
MLAFEPDSAGGLMNTDTVSVRPDVTLETVLRYLRMRGDVPDNTDSLFVVNRHDRYLGTLDLARLLTEDPERTRRRGDGHGRARHHARHARHARSRACSRTATCSRPRWSDADGRLLGRITVDDVVDVIRDEAEHSVMSMAGLDEEADMFAGVMPERAPPRRLARHQPRHRVPRRLGRGPVRGHDPEHRRARGADAHRGQHGRRRGHADPDADRARPRARPGRAGERPLAAQPRDSPWRMLNGVAWATVVARGRLPLVRELEDRRGDLRRDDRQPAGGGARRRAGAARPAAASASTRPSPAASSSPPSPTWSASPRCSGSGRWC